jgi:uncharacterized protein (TIGR02996 family)
MKIVRACSSPEECKLLRAALADFSRDGARRAYSDWLSARGDEARARVVRATIDAFESLDTSAFNDLRANLCWTRMISIPFLLVLDRARANHDADDLRRFRDLVFPRIRPALSLSYSPCKAEPDVGASYFWGLPDIPEGEAWPRVSSLSDLYSAKAELPHDHPAAFLGQIAFGDLHETVLGQELPRDGGFAVFAITEVWKLGIVETLVRPWNREATLTRCPAPSDLVEDRLGDSVNSPLPPHTIELEETLSLPDATDGLFAHEIPGCALGESYHALYEELRDACGAGVLGIGGHLRGTSGSDPSPGTSYLRLAVLRVTPDTGVVHFAIPAADLMGGRLDAVKYVWNDWDS